MIDTDAFSSALRAGDLDACLELLRGCDSRASNTAVLNRRLAEALFHRGWRDEALECGRRTFALAAGDPETAYFCAWLFSNCDCHQDAAVAYQRLLVGSPDGLKAIVI